MTPAVLKGLCREYGVLVPKGTLVDGLRDLYRRQVLPRQEEAYLLPADTSTAQDGQHPGRSQDLPNVDEISHADNAWNECKIKDLQRILKANGLPYSSRRKQGLIDRCIAHNLDGKLENVLS